jgi:NEDD8-activating enzyme E1 regulatory subunit
VHALSTWRTTHNNQTPTTYAEKTAFKKSIRDMKKKADEENFDEAEAQAWRLWTTSGVPIEITELLNLLSQISPQNPPSPQNAPFYTMLEALRRFAQLEEYRGLLPLSGALPDMKSDTER